MDEREEGGGGVRVASDAAMNANMKQNNKKITYLLDVRQLLIESVKT